MGLVCEIVLVMELEDGTKLQVQEQGWTCILPLVNELVAGEWDCGIFPVSGSGGEELGYETALIWDVI